MTQLTDLNPPEAQPNTDLVAEVHQIMQASEEPLTLSKIRSHLPAHARSIDLEKLAETLRRQVVANVLWQFPRYRSQQDRFWDRPMPVHVAHLLRGALGEGPLSWSELRRKLPTYAQAQAEAVLQEQIAQGTLYRYPRAGRSGERFGLVPPDPRDYLRTELAQVFERLNHLGFSPNNLREAALELLHEEEWASPPPVPAPENVASQEPAVAEETSQPSGEIPTPAPLDNPEMAALSQPAPQIQAPQEQLPSVQEEPGQQGDLF